MLNKEKKVMALTKKVKDITSLFLFTIWAMTMPTYIDRNIKESHILLAKT